MREQLLVSLLRAKSGIGSDVISDQDLSLIIEADLAEYVFYRPGTSITPAASAIVTVAGTPSYDLPEDALWPIEVTWDPSASALAGDVGLEALYLELEQGTVDANHPSELHAMYQRLTEYRTFFAGRWKVIDDKVWLIPAPEVSGQRVAVFYAKARTLADLHSVKDQRFLNLVRSSMMERRGTDMVSGGSWKAGSLAVDNSKVGQSLLSAAQRLREQTLDAIRNNYMGASSVPGDKIG